MNPLRDDLLSAGCALVAEAADGYRATPPSVASLCRVVTVLRAHRCPLSIRGSGDAPVLPGAGGVVLDLSALDRIPVMDGETGIAQVEAGCSVNALETAAWRAGATLGPLLPSVRAGSVGAWLAGPTRGERGIPGARRETAALAVSSVLGDGKLAESRAAPRSATGPDLDHLALGGQGRLCVIALAWVRLFPASPALSSSWRVRDLLHGLGAVERLCKDRLAPARVRIQGGRLALAWEGMETAPLDRDRAARVLASLSCELAPESETNLWIRASAAGQAIELDAQWDALARLGASASELQLVGLHAGGSFAVLAHRDQGVDECARLSQRAGARVLAPRRLRAAGPSWEAMGAGAVWLRLVDALGVANDDAHGVAIAALGVANDDAQGVAIAAPDAAEEP